MINSCLCSVKSTQPVLFLNYFMNTVFGLIFAVFLLHALTQSPSAQIKLLFSCLFIFTLTFFTINLISIAHYILRHTLNTSFQKFSVYYQIVYTCSMTLLTLNFAGFAIFFSEDKQRPYLLINAFIALLFLMTILTLGLRIQRLIRKLDEESREKPVNMDEGFIGEVEMSRDDIESQ